jgi:CMP-N-acetylneuraminic acid synthetase/spore coat polysaccharide biosynthesis predicted glycosyltransferase SpsG
MLNENLKLLFIIPARFGSKGIPRKNLKILNGKPLIFYSINNALKISCEKEVVVSSDSDEILNIATKFGAKALKRPAELAGDQTTLDPVVFHAYKSLSVGLNFDYVVILQPTSPLLSAKSLESALMFISQNKKIDSIISVREERHLSWKYENGEYIPNYKERKNRQYLDPKYVETGGFVISKPQFISKNSKLGQMVSVWKLPQHESIDIDDFNDWNICENYLSRKKVLFVVSGYKEIGLGHVYNVLSIADELSNFEFHFLVDRNSQLALKKIKENNFNVTIQTQNSLSNSVIDLKPQLVINDILDTKADYIKKLKENKIKVINFEDLGEGSKYADIVVNAMYESAKTDKKNIYFGSDYFCLKTEFYFTNPKRFSSIVSKIVISFGGVDPNNLTLLCLQSIYDFCVSKNIEIYVITGLGYQLHQTLSEFENIKIIKNTSQISTYFNKADVIFTSGGRTTFEAAILGKPSIVLCQNEREMTHYFLNKNKGIINLGLGNKNSKSSILNCFTTLTNDEVKRRKMHNFQLEHNLANSKKNVIKLINNLVST